jgi:hypothetical protein
MPTHRDMPQSWQEHARRRSDDVTRAVEHARALREQTAVKTLPELARERRSRLTAADAARAATSVPPPSLPPFPPTAA